MREILFALLLALIPAAVGAQEAVTPEEADADRDAVVNAEAYVHEIRASGNFDALPEATKELVAEIDAYVRAYWALQSATPVEADTPDDADLEAVRDQVADLVAAEPGQN
tara:strand:+ start:1463 stop:1792 length:330 start_codon:yes stop_codon:yes gene_type:complete